MFVRKTDLLNELHVLPLKHCAVGWASRWKEQVAREPRSILSTGVWVRSRNWEFRYRKEC